MLLTAYCFQSSTLVERWYHMPHRVHATRWVCPFHALDYVLTETGCLIRVVLMAVVCDKPATHKISGFASHSHTNFCTLCWISMHEKDKPAAFLAGGELCMSHLLILTHSLQYSTLGRTQTIVSLMKNTTNFLHPPHTRISSRTMQPVICSSPISPTLTWSNRLWLTPCTTSFLVRTLSIRPVAASWPPTELVKTHFYNIWIQHKILHANHELEVFHTMLANVMFYLHLSLLLACDSST